MKEGLERNYTKIVGEALKWNIRNHFKTIYPNSQHYSPDKVNLDNDGNVVIDVPGITRAYSDIDIRPVRAKSLTIPIHRTAYGKKAE